MHLNHTKLIYSALFLASAFLTACGGGGGGNTAPAATYTIGGSITGLSTGQVVQLQNNNTDTISITGNGTGTDGFSFPTKVVSGSYTVTVLSKPATLTCTPSGNPFQVNGDINSVAVTCSVNTYTIGGTIAGGGGVTGLTGTGLKLRNNGANELSITVDGDFVFTTPVAGGAGYAVTVSTQPTSPNQRCTVANATGTANANVTNVAVNCIPVYTISANVSGLGTPPSIGLTLQNTGNNNLSITANGTSTFSKALAQGESYDVKVLVQPAAPALTCTVTGGDSGTGSGIVATSPVSVDIACVTPVPSYAYVANYNSNNISAYSIDPVTGVLTSVGTVAAGTGPQSVTVVPSGKFAYVANIISSDISAYTINAGTGALTQISCGGGIGCSSSNNFLAGTGPISVTVDSSGRFAYVANLNSGDISAYAINAATGALTQISCTGGTTICSGNNFRAGNNPSAVTVDHTGQFAYVANANDNSVSAYTIDAATGALTKVLCGGSITACGAVDPLDSTTIPNGDNFLAGAGPQSIEVDPASRFAYVANANGDSVSAYTINALTGGLTQIDCTTAGGVCDTSGVNFLAGTAPTSIVVDTTGKYVYVANYGSNNISAYSIDNAPGGTGALTAIGSPIPAGTSPTSITVDLSGKFVYVANYGTGASDVSAYNIGGSGALSAIGGSPFAAGTNPASVITTVVY